MRRLPSRRREGHATCKQGARGTPIVRFADADGGATILDAYGLQLQPHAVPGVPVEARIDVEWVEESGAYRDGTRFSLRWPAVVVRSPAFGSVAPGASGVRLAPNLIGLGLLEAIPEADIRANADVGDRDGDGISGVASEVLSDGRSALGRFGLKANVATVADQVAAAYLFDMGITSPAHPVENRPGSHDACRQALSGGSPEISPERSPVRSSCGLR